MIIAAKQTTFRFEKSCQPNLFESTRGSNQQALRFGSGNGSPDMFGLCIAKASAIGTCICGC